MSTDERNLFISYSHSDAAWLERLKVHLRPLIRRAELDLWDDSRIVPGQSWHDEIVKALGRAHVAVLLVSADFLASDFVVNNELPPILHRAAHDGLLVLPLIVSPCLFIEHEELSRYQCVNTPDRPLSGMSYADSESALLSLARSVAQYFRILDSAPPRPFVYLTTEISSRQASSVTVVPERVRATDAQHHTEASPRSPLVVDRPLNLSFDGSAVEGIPVGWFNSFGHVSGVSTDYSIRVVQRSQNRREGTCVVLEKSAPVVRQFGSLMQRCPGRLWAGRTLRLVGELRTDSVSDWAGLWLRADAENEPNLFFDNMSSRPVTGTTDWAQYFIDAPIPTNTDWLNFGIVLSGPGALYADNFRILVWNADGRWEDA